MRYMMDGLIASPDPRFDRPSTTAPITPVRANSGLTERYFVLQDQRPTRLRDIELGAMDPTLRTLLFTDGTVTRTLEAQILSRVTVDVATQTFSEALGLNARHLDAPADTKTVRRRVTICIDSLATPVIWAESHLLPDRLPAGFLPLLDDTPEGIGESLQQIKLEGWREMLWFGLDLPPTWDVGAARAAPTFLTRQYRVITEGRPALLISESFAVEQRGGIHSLALGPHNVPNSSSISAISSSSEAESRS